MKCVAVAALLMISGCSSLPRQKTPVPALSVFVDAHHDDWQLFKNTSAFHAMN
jgi:hypothetical protein